MDVRITDEGRQRSRSTSNDSRSRVMTARTSARSTGPPANACKATKSSLLAIVRVTYPNRTCHVRFGSSGSIPRRLLQEQRRVNVEFPSWMIESLDREAGRLGVTRQSIIESWLAERLAQTASEK